MESPITIILGCSLAEPSACRPNVAAFAAPAELAIPLSNPSGIVPASVTVQAARPEIPKDVTKSARIESMAD